MSTSTYIESLNANDPKFVRATTGTPEELQKWEDENGPISERPGADVEPGPGEGYTETEEEYGGWLIAIKDLPRGTTHIHVTRG